MRKFLLVNLIILLVTIALHYAAALMADGYIDNVYNKFTSGPQKSLILGLSRAANAINPEILNKELKSGPYSLPVFNFAIAFPFSPYGPLYLQAIKNKLDPGVKNGLFILTVDPGCISEVKEFKEEPEKFRENSTGILEVRDASPNIGYLLKFYEYGWGKIIIDHFFSPKDKSFLHKNGWREIRRLPDRALIAMNTLETVEAHRKEFFKANRISNVRLTYLADTIRYLNKHGTTFLVRLPVDRKILRLEVQMIPGFNELINELAKKNGAEYMDLSTEENYLFTDGEHMLSHSANEFSKFLSRKINASKKHNHHHPRH